MNIGEFPVEIPARVQYGNGVKALSVLLNTGLNMPRKSGEKWNEDNFQIFDALLMHADLAKNRYRL